MKFTEYKKNIIDENIDISLRYLIVENYRFSYNYLNEDIDDIFKSKFKVHKTKGILQYLSGFTDDVRKLIFAAINGDRKEIKKISEHITKEKIIDFLLKLDEATFHILTGPLHIIDAVTGWNILDAIKHKYSPEHEYSVDNIVIHIEEIKEEIEKMIHGENQKRLLKILNNFEKTLLKMRRKGNIK